MSRGIYVSGYSSGAGKSTICCAILSALLRSGNAPDTLAYIKPVTQCEAETPVAVFCREKGIPAIPVGPIVFRAGVTKTEIMNPRTNPTMLEVAVAAVRGLVAGKNYIVVDGMGYPSGGSCCGVGGGDVAGALGLPVILIGTSGVGDAIDTNTLMHAYYAFYNVRVCGVLFNKIAGTARHSIEDMKSHITEFYRRAHPRVRVLGFLKALAADEGHPKAALKPVDVTVYVTEGCAFCGKVKNLFASLQASPTYLTSADPQYEVNARLYGHPTLPLVMVQGTFLGGWAETATAAASGDLQRRLGLADMVGASSPPPVDVLSDRAVQQAEDVLTPEVVLPLFGEFCW